MASVGKGSRHCFFLCFYFFFKFSPACATSGTSKVMCCLFLSHLVPSSAVSLRDSAAETGCFFALSSDESGSRVLRSAKVITTNPPLLEPPELCRHFLALAGPYGLMTSLKIPCFSEVQKKTTKCTCSNGPFKPKLYTF